MKFVDYCISKICIGLALLYVLLSLLSFVIKIDELIPRDVLIFAAVAYVCINISEKYEEKQKL